MFKPLVSLSTAVVLAAAPAFAHAHGTVESASPKNGSTLASPPTEIRLRFSEAVEPTFTSVKLLGPTGDAVPLPEKTRVEDGRVVVQSLPTLAPGGYKAQWMSAGHDGHHIHGELSFTVK